MTSNDFARPPRMADDRTFFEPFRAGLKRSRILVLVGLVALGLGWGPSAQAASEQSGLTLLDRAEDPVYHKLIKEGLAEYDAGNYAEARSFFMRAHKISPNARTFRGIGMASFELRDYVSAVHNLSAALKDHRKPLNPEMAKNAQDLLERSRIFVDVYRLTVSPKNARVLIDGRVPEYEDDGTLILGLGVHALEATAPGYAVRSIPINVRGGEQRKELSVTLEKLGDPASPRFNPAPPPVGTVQTPRPQLQSSIFDNAGVIWLFTAGATSLASGGLGYLWWREEKQIEKCRAKSSECYNLKDLKEKRNLNMGFTIGTAAAAAIMTVISIATWDSPPPPAEKQGLLDCTLTPFGVSCSRTF